MTRWTGLLVAAVVLAGGAGTAGAAPCLLVNPSFEVPGSGVTFGGWNQFGPTGSTAEAAHGHVAARVSGPNTGTPSGAGFWQPLDTAPGKRWAASVRAWNTSAMPLAGSSKAILKVEWWGAGNNLISYESHTIASAASPTDTWIDFAVESGPAPTGTATTRLVLAVEQGATDPQPTVYFDQATFHQAGPPTLDDIQWNDFPGGRSITFSGRQWRVKGPGYYGPGPNLFCDHSGCVWVDAGGRLHLTLQNLGGQWYSTEVAAEQPLGYGDYVFTTVGRLDLLDPGAVFGLFLWQYGFCYDPALLWWNPFNEIDIEFSRWGNPQSDIAQFVAQPYDWPGNIDRFDAAFANGELTSHAFRWLPDRVEYRSWRGGPGSEAPATMIHTWTYTGPHVPRPEQPRVHLNLWRFDQPPASMQEVVLDSFTFVPAPGVVAVPRPGDAPPRADLRPSAWPNPFAAATRIRYTLPHEGAVDLAVYDIGGRRVRTLAGGHQAAGVHEAAWDGRDASGRRQPPGVYLCRLSTGQRSATGRVVLLR